VNAPRFPMTVEDGAVILTLDRSNCLDVAGKHALTTALSELKGREDLRALIIAGEHPQAFLVDVAELADMSAAALDAAKAFVRRLSPTRAASVAAIKAAAIFGWNRDPADINRFEEDRFATLFGPEQSQRMHAFLARRQEPAK
jgi:enoyl-CoA hydratase/carnithine racemase